MWTFERWVVVDMAAFKKVEYRSKSPTVLWGTVTYTTHGESRLPPAWPWRVSFFSGTCSQAVFKTISYKRLEVGILLIILRITMLNLQPKTHPNPHSTLQSSLLTLSLTHSSLKT